MDYNYKEILLKTVQKYCELTGRVRGGVANAIANDGKFFDNIEKGGTCTMDTYVKAMKWLNENMPKSAHTAKSKKLIKKPKSN